MPSWERTTLGSICERTGGSIQTGPFGSQLHASDYVEDGIPSVMPQNIGDNRIVEDGIARVSPADIARLSRYLLRTGDIVYSRRGDVERRALIRPENDGWLCGTGCLRVRLGSNKDYDSRFISYALGTPASREWITRHAVGATMLNLNTGILAAVPLTIPSANEQRAIADILGALDDKAAANEDVVRIADDLGCAVASGASDGQVEQLASIAEVTMGSSPPGTSYNEDGDGVPFYQGVRDFGVRFPSNRVWTTAPVRIANEKETLVSVRAPVGHTNLAGETLCIGRGLAALRSRHNHPYSLFYQVRAAHDAWAPFEAEGTIFGSINKQQLGAIEVPTIRDGRAERLEDELASIERRIWSALRENQLLATTRDELLPLLMSGRVTVRDAEKVVEEVA